MTALKIENFPTHCEIETLPFVNTMLCAVPLANVKKIIDLKGESTEFIGFKSTTPIEKFMSLQMFSLAYECVFVQKNHEMGNLR